MVMACPIAPMVSHPIARPFLVGNQLAINAPSPIWQKAVPAICSTLCQIVNSVREPERPHKNREIAPRMQPMEITTLEPTLSQYHVKNAAPMRDIQFATV